MLGAPFARLSLYAEQRNFCAGLESLIVCQQIDGVYIASGKRTAANTAAAICKIDGVIVPVGTMRNG